jgi:hypothetical protein
MGVLTLLNWSQFLTFKAGIFGSLEKSKRHNNPPSNRARIDELVSRVMDFDCV